MADPHGFLRYQRQEAQHRPVPLRLMDYREVYEQTTGDHDKTQAARCMDCGVPFCHEGCPLGNIIPEWNDLVRQGRWREAFDRLHATNNFPDFTGRLCPAPCEGACVLGINDDAVTIKHIEQKIIDVGFDNGWVEPVKASFDTGRCVAVVGSGPAGLAAAQQLTRAGHRVTVFERDDRLGGLMRYGVPEYKMEKSHIDRRIEQMRAEGTEFRVNTSPTAADLADFNAVVLATGTPVPRDLPVDGRELDGIHFAMDYLTAANKYCEGDTDAPAIDAHGKKVVIIGGGDTGTDCFGTALRQGAASVTQFDIRARAPKFRGASTPWPMYPLLFRTATAHEEGNYVITGDESADEIARLGLAARGVGDSLGTRLFSVNTVSFHGSNGTVSSLRGNEVRVIDGRRTPVEDTDFEMDADLVLIALGFSGSKAAGLNAELGITIDERGRMTRDGSYRAARTTEAGPAVYVAGDCGRGQSLIVWAIAEGRAAAAAVDADLMGETALPSPVEPTKAPLSI
ncbi:glutamate synthase subunit beta [Corynebacterium liangguodongii]|uniref:Glutamate synthase n=1 Tax=Corynebacterium liangguodongii TaxID=2079535 RepID=A0A2S0WCM1_9CORY|nr:glutamate synthase subunit beta [Corynebacterium liangguodongii]AWB83515.1 glutamate synthase [Corynebacterium liangguodongii]PWC00396.1 glutamate synthase subunit beta [Corynebacterium liangguodongii]